MMHPAHKSTSDFTVVVDTVHLENLLHRATTIIEGEDGSSFTFYSDEGADLGGDDTHPYPLDYLGASVGL